MYNPSKPISKHYKRRIQRRSRRLEELEERHKGKETTLYNYHGGFDLGYLAGSVSTLEDALDDITELENEIKQLKEELKKAIDSV